MQHDAWGSVAARLLQDRGREGVVEGDVPAIPGAHDGRIDHRPLRQVPHLVLEEPQERIGNDVVGLLVDGAFNGRETQPYRVVTAGRLAQQLRIGRRAAIAFAHGRRDPRQWHVPADLSECRYQATRAAARTQRSIRRAGERDRPTVGGDDQPAIPEQRGRRRTQGAVGVGIHRVRTGSPRTPRRGS